MASSANYGGSGASSSPGPGPSAWQAWNSPSNATTSNNSRSDSSGAAAGIPGFSSEYLHVTNFGFAIPTGATIDGVLVEWEGKSDDPSRSNPVTHVYLIKGGSRTGSNKGGSDPWTTTSDVVASYGGAADLWGTTLTVSDVNASNFGCALAVTENNAANAINTSVDSCRITVYYTEAAGGMVHPRRSRRVTNLRRM